jgi:hypothetical protein
MRLQKRQSFSRERDRIDASQLKISLPFTCMIAGSLFIGGKDWTGGEDLTCKSCDGSKKHNIQD